MTIRNSELADADEVLNLTGKLFKNQLQTICNADLIGINAKMNLASGNLNLKNTYFNSGKTDTADIKYGMIYDATNKYWATPDLSSATIGTEYVIIEATSLSSAISNVNSCYSVPIASGKWLIYCSTGTDAVRRAQIIKTLFYGTDGTDAKILTFTGVTAVKTTHTNDVGKTAHYAYAYTPGFDNTMYPQNASYVGTFSDTTTNTNCSVWSNLHTHYYSQQKTTTLQFPVGTSINIASSSGINTVESFEIGTDRESDEKDNQTNIGIFFSSSVDSAQAGGWGKLIVLCNGVISWTETDTGGYIAVTNTDFYTDHSIPAFTSITEEFFNAYVTFKSTPTENVTNAIMCANYSIDPTSSIQYSMSTDGTNWVNCDDSEICDLPSGSDIYRKITITRTDLSKVDKVSQEGVFYNVR